ncbi:MAG: phenylacetate--CoA ligase family protein [Gemmatimonadaceae bacterium]
MNAATLRLYHRLPAGARSVVATLRGHHLRRWRYGPETERLVAEALERESWSESQWSRYQSELLDGILHRAATKVPYYRNQWAERRRHGDRSAWEDLSSWPVLEKDVLRAQPRAFVAEDCDPRRMFKDHTSGTTGRSLGMWFSRDTVRRWYALFEARARRWYGVSRHDRWAIVGGQLVTPIQQRRPPFWVWNSALNQLYLSVWHLTPEFSARYFEALERYRIRYLLGYSSALFVMAEEALRIGWHSSQLAVTISNAEPLLKHQRSAIEAAFGCSARETYGMAELVATASECEARSMHLWPELGVVETMDQGSPVEPGGTGDLVCTGLLNPDMPLVRYRVGDRAALPAEPVACACGRSLPMLGSIEGRSDDVVFTRDGRRIGQLESIFRINLPIREAQLVQESLDRIRVRFVPDDGFGPEHERVIVERLQLRLGDIQTVMEPVASVPRAANGKFRYVVSNLAPRERGAATNG